MTNDAIGYFLTGVDGDEIKLMGGPMDGRRMKVPTRNGYPLIRLLVPRPVDPLLESYSAKAFPWPEDVLAHLVYDRGEALSDDDHAWPYHFNAGASRS